MNSARYFISSSSITRDELSPRREASASIADRIPAGRRHVQVVLASVDIVGMVPEGSLDLARLVRVVLN